MVFLLCLAGCFGNQAQKPRNAKPTSERDSSGIEPVNSTAAFNEGGTFHEFDKASSVNILSNAQNTTLYNPVFNEYRTGKVEESAIMDKLRSHTDPNAAVDSGARQPAPTCHPKTRLEVRKTLAGLFDDPQREYSMTWLFGAAGTGKTAVGQSFSEECQDRGQLGATFFFSRPNGRNRYETVIPSVAYQLSDHCSYYRSALIATIEKNHQIFDKAPPVQFQKLIVEPLLALRSKITTRYLILLDGVDECGANQSNGYEREREQCELIKIIADTVRDHLDLPLFWLLCSRPEQHLQKAHADITPICRREELAIDAKCREEVEVVLREGFAKIAKDRDIIPPGSDGWPSREEFETVERAVSGLHVFGAAILRDVEHSDAPVEQLVSLIPFLEHVAGTGPTRSIGDMDEFYIRILDEVLKERLPTTLKIIGALITIMNPGKFSAQALCNFLRLDPNDFSSSLRKVHSVINLPSPETVHNTALHLYHASFSDFLTDASRAGKFFIDRLGKALPDLIELCFFWHQLHSNLFHSSEQPLAVYCSELKHDHDPLPRANLKWITSAESHQAISNDICTFAEKYCFSLFEWLPKKRCDKLLTCIHNSDLRHLSYNSWIDAANFFNWVYEQEPSDGFICTKPENDGDRKLLAYLRIVTKKPITPASLPFIWPRGLNYAAYREYVLIGRNSRTIIVWITGTRKTHRIMALNLDQEPDERTIERYEESLRETHWQGESVYNAANAWLKLRNSKS